MQRQPSPCVCAPAAAAAAAILIGGRRARARTSSCNCRVLVRALDRLQLTANCCYCWRRWGQVNSRPNGGGGGGGGGALQCCAAACALQTPNAPIIRLYHFPLNFSGANFVFFFFSFLQATCARLFPCTRLRSAKPIDRLVLTTSAHSSSGANQIHVGHSARASQILSPRINYLDLSFQLLFSSCGRSHHP